MNKQHVRNQGTETELNDLNYYFFVDEVNEKFPGFSKIMEKIKAVFINVKTINSIQDTNGTERIIPFGIVASNLYLKKYKKGEIAFIMDSSTLCFKSMVRFYVRRRSFFNKHLIGAALRYIKYYFVERQVIRNFDKVIVVSEHDASYLERKFNCSNVEVITNGADFPNLKKKQPKEFNYTLGILSYWGAGNYNDVKWFFTDYLPELKIIYPEIKIITAGRGADEYTLNLFKQHNIEHQGEIEDLWEFFNKIDIYVTTLRKECGILNKVLDAMAHQKIVIGLEHNMYAFKNLQDGFFSYNSLKEFVQHLETIRINPELVRLRTNSAYKFISEYHNWEKNYRQMKSLIDTYYAAKQL